MTASKAQIRVKHSQEKAIPSVRTGSWLDLTESGRGVAGWRVLATGGSMMAGCGDRICWETEHKIHTDLETFFVSRMVNRNYFATLIKKNIKNHTTQVSMDMN